MSSSFSSCLTVLRILVAVGIAASQAFAATFSQPDAKHCPSLFTWTDTCNVYVLRDGDAALLINLGNGSVLDHLADIGVRRVEWVLFTDHHREQSQGASKLGPWRERGAKVAAPEAERALFESPLDFRKMNVNLGDAFTIHGASFVRPPIQAIPLDRTFATHDTFTWRGREFACVDTRGSSPGGMTYRLRENGLVLAFSGDVMLDGARMHTWFDTEWDYGFAVGIQALRKSVAWLTESDIAWLLPSHGPAARAPLKQLHQYAAKLERLEKVYLRGYDPEGGSVAYQDKVSKPTVVSNVWHILHSPHCCGRREDWSATHRFRHHPRPSAPGRTLRRHSRSSAGQAVRPWSSKTPRGNRAYFSPLHLPRPHARSTETHLLSPPMNRGVIKSG